MTRPRILFSMASALLCLTASVGNCLPPGAAPATTAGLDVVLTIEHTESSLAGGFPTMGAVTQTYAADGSYVYAGFGGPNHLTGTGTYTYARTGQNTATEDAVQYSSFFTLPYHMEYTFQTASTGRWKQYFAGGLIVFEGRFATSPSSTRVEWAPRALAGATLVLLTADQQQFDISIVSHRAADYRAFDGQSRRIETGTYAAKQMSAKSLVVENTGPDGQIVRSFTFASRGGGAWTATRLSDGARSEGFFLLLR
jgi:hypothetical protein